jgi:hypothetical protein
MLKEWEIHYKLCVFLYGNFVFVNNNGYALRIFKSIKSHFDSIQLEYVRIQNKTFAVRIC